jgi:hypothetical protein
MGDRSKVILASGAVRIVLAIVAGAAAGSVGTYQMVAPGPSEEVVEPLQIDDVFPVEPCPDVTCAELPAVYVECPPPICPKPDRAICLCSHDSEYGELYAQPPSAEWEPSRED